MHHLPLSSTLYRVAYGRPTGVAFTGLRVVVVWARRPCGASQTGVSGPDAVNARLTTIANRGLPCLSHRPHQPTASWPISHNDRPRALTSRRQTTTRRSRTATCASDAGSAGGRITTDAFGQAYSWPKKGNKRGPNHITTCEGISERQRADLGDRNVIGGALVEQAMRDVYAGHRADFGEAWDG